MTAIVFSAAAVRFAGLDYSVPFHFHVDEQLMLVSTVSLVQDPSRAVHEKYFFNYGSLPRMIAGMPLAAAHAAGRLHLEQPNQVRAYYLLARSVSALAGTLTVLLVGIIAAGLIGSWGGLLPPLLLAFSPLHLRDSHFFTPDPLLVLFTTATMAGAIWLMRTATSRAALAMGAAAGLALATKLNAVFALGPIAVSLATSGRRRVLPAAAGLAGGFILGNWPLLLAPREFLNGIMTLASWARGAAVRQADLQFVGTMPWIYWLDNLLRFGAGPVLWVCGLAGMAYLALRRGPGWLMVLAAGVPYFAVMGASFQKFIRFSLPLHPVIALAAGALLAALARRGGVARSAVAILMAIHLAVGLAYAGVFLREDPRIRAGRELSEALPPGTTVLLETTHSNPPLIEEDLRKGLFGSYLPTLGQPLATRVGRFRLQYIDPYVYLYEIATGPEEQWACITAALEGADVVIIGNRYRDQYARLPDRFPAMARFYRELDSGARGFSCVRLYRNPARIGPIEIDDSRSELTFRLFDRPLLKVYARPDSPAWRTLCTRPG
ncbi:MAG: phospholipid carrier-dependent glycosyltransferase [Candidatus Eisenbacteria bacterium]|nr:phospholipid carrier-dependent glycosyltransferase [Candidatus Eisenbacteria bacterium]